MQAKMENSSSYGSNPLPPPPSALVAFSQANNLSDPLRLGRPFPQGIDNKDLPIPFSTAALGLRPIDTYAGLSTPLFNLQHPFFAHSLEPRLAFAASAFRPLNPGDDHGLKNFHPGLSLTAAHPLLKPHGKLDAALAFNLNRYPLFPSLDSPMAPNRLLYNGQRSAASPSNSPGAGGPGTTPRSISDDPIALDGRDAAATPSSDAGTERSTPDEIRSLRRRKKTSPDPSCCPVCGITLRLADLESHFAQELERLERVCRPPTRASSSSPAPVASSSSSMIRREQDTRWETYQRVRINRHNRVRTKARKRRADERDDSGAEENCGPAGTPCPVCGEKLHGSSEELNQHVVQCLRKHNGDIDDEDDEPLDVEGDGETFEEYEWAGQRRIRATTLLEGGFSGAGMVTCKRRTTAEDESEDVVVDADDTAAFGPDQFTENDIATAVENGPQEPSCSSASAENELECSPLGGETLCEQGSPHIIEALKKRIQELENQTKDSKQKTRCLICLGNFRKPVVSTACWHVHCEECWLSSLASKKLCPQCNLITSPAQLRRVYM